MRRSPDFMSRDLVQLYWLIADAKDAILGIKECGRRCARDRMPLYSLADDCKTTDISCSGRMQALGTAGTQYRSIGQAGEASCNFAGMFRDI